MTTSDITTDPDTIALCRGASLLVDMAILKIQDAFGLNDEERFEWAENNKEKFLQVIGLLAISSREVGLERGIIVPDKPEEQP